MAKMWEVKFDTAQFNRNVARVMPELKAEAAKVVDKQAQAFASTIRNNVPKHPLAPHIGDTVRIEDGDPAKIEKVVSIGDAATPYAAPLEYGHVTASGGFVEGARFWTPAKKIFNRKFRAAMKRTVRRAFKRFI